VQQAAAQFCTIPANINLKIGSSLFLCGYHHKNQCGLESKTILLIENDKKPKKVHHLRGE
jgi:hypothetical protein